MNRLKIRADFIDSGFSILLYSWLAINKETGRPVASGWEENLTWLI
jgi:hypothetical protein